MGRLFISKMRGVFWGLIMMGFFCPSVWAGDINGYGPDGLRPDAESIALVAKAVEEVSERLLDAKEHLVVLSVEGRDTRRSMVRIAMLEEVLFEHKREFSEMIQIISDSSHGELPTWLKGTMMAVLERQGQVSDPRFYIKKKRRTLHADLSTEINRSDMASWLTVDKGTSELVVHLELPVIFSEGGSRVSGEYRDTLRRVAGVLKSYRPVVVVTGYTGLSTAPTHFVLSAERAANVAREFLDAGISSDAFSIRTRQEAMGMDRVEVSFRIPTSDAVIPG